jgi:hypothetical protein
VTSGQFFTPTTASPTSLHRSPGRLGSIYAVGLLGLLLLLLVPAAASAAPPEHEFLETFGSANQPTFTDPAGMTVDPATGDVYVIDLEGQPLSRFNEALEFQSGRRVFA